MKSKNIIKCNIRVEDSADCFNGDIYLPANRTYTLIIDYPLSNPYHKTIKTKKGMGTAALIKEIGKAYNHVYKIDDTECKKNDFEPTFGVWGHGIEDLVIEGINVKHKRKLITLYVGS